MVASWKNDALRRIPAVEQLLAEPETQALTAQFGRSQVLEAVRTVTAAVRQAIGAAEEESTLPGWIWRLLLTGLSSSGNPNQAQPDPGDQCHRCCFTY